MRGDGGGPWLISLQSHSKPAHRTNHPTDDINYIIIIGYKLKTLEQALSTTKRVSAIHVPDPHRQSDTLIY